MDVYLNIVLPFWCYNKYSTYKAKRFILPCNFGSSSQWLIGPIAIRPVSKQDIIVAAHGKTAHFIARIQKKKREIGRDRGSIIPLEDTPPVTRRLPTKPLKVFFPVTPSWGFEGTLQMQSIANIFWFLHLQQVSRHLQVINVIYHTWIYGEWYFILPL